MDSLAASFSTLLCVAKDQLALLLSPPLLDSPNQQHMLHLPGHVLAAHVAGFLTLAEMNRARLLSWTLFRTLDPQSANGCLAWRGHYARWASQDHHSFL